MKFFRFIVWPIAVASYLSVFTALIHWLTNTWSGAASLGMLFTVLIGVPSLFSYAGSVWLRKRMRGLERVEAFVGIALPAVVLLLAGMVIVFEEIR